MPKPVKYETIVKFPSQLYEMLSDKKKATFKQGESILKTKIKQIGELAPNGQPIEFSRVITIKAGDKVPKEFSKIPGIKIDPNGILQAAYTDGWCQSHWNDNGGWVDSWGECWDNSTSMINPKESLVSFALTQSKIASFKMTEFTSKELEAISKFKI